MYSLKDTIMDLMAEIVELFEKNRREDHHIIPTKDTSLMEDIMGNIVEHIEGTEIPQDANVTRKGNLCFYSFNMPLVEVDEHGLFDGGNVKEYWYDHCRN